MCNRSVLAAVLGFLSLAEARPAVAQAFPLPAGPPTGLSIESLHPRFRAGNGPSDATFPSSAWSVSARFPLMARVHGLAQLPVAFARSDADPSAEWHGALGNPMVGLEFAASPRLQLEAGARVPLMTEEAAWNPAIGLGYGSDPQSEAFWESTWSTFAAATFTQPLPSGMEVRSRAGVAAATYTGAGRPWAEASHILVDYGLSGAYTAGRGRLGLAFSGRWAASADEGGFTDNSVHLVGASADLAVGRLRPGISFRLPVHDPYAGHADYTVGAYLLVPLW